jgi:multiple sugar transport system permease protein
VDDLRLLNTQWAIILPITAMPVGVFLLRQFSINIPRELEDAANIDGCSSLGILLRIILPMSTPALSALAIFVFIFTWNEFFWSMIALQRREVFTIPIGLRVLQGAYDIQYGLLMAAAALASLPALLVYLALQRQIIARITMSSAEIK